MKIFGKHFTTTPSRNRARRRRASTLLEAMILIMVLSAIALGTGIALQTLVHVPESNDRALVISNLMIDKMEQLRALGFTTLSTTANGSDLPTIDGITYTRSWTITNNPGGTYDANFLKISVAIANRSLTSAVCKQ